MANLRHLSRIHAARNRSMGGYRPTTNGVRLANHYGGLGGTSRFKAVRGGNRSIDGKYDRVEAHGVYWTASENDPTTAPFYNFGKGGQALYRQPQGHKQMAISVRCLRE